MDRYLADKIPSEKPMTSFTRDHGIAWADYRLDKAFKYIEAPPELAALFEVEPGTRLLERRFVFYAKGVPSQTSRSCLLASDVEGTPVADPRNEPWPGGNIGQLRTLGIEIDDVEEDVHTRLPTPEEVEALRLPSAVPVFAIVRRMLAAGRVVEVADPIVIPGDRAVLSYRIRLDQV
jgi:GntR family transcriptional regulator